MADASTTHPEAPTTVRWQASTLAIAGAAGPLALRTCLPDMAVVRAQVVLAAAIGVPQTFYTAFAQWLAAQGFAVTTFDYRGHAASQRGPLRTQQADLMDWAQDCHAVAAHLRGLDTAAGAVRPLYWLGHSVGAQLPGLCQSVLPIDGLLAIASGSGYWRDNALPTKRKVLLWWWLIQPMVTTMYGCLPGKRWGLVGDLPAGVVWQWRRWCMHPDYSLGVEGERVRQSYGAARYPVHALAVEDDEMMSLRSTQSLVGWYRNAPQTIESLRPQEAGVPRIGHFGFFRAAMAATLWPRALAVLQRWEAGDGGPLAPAGQGGAAEIATVQDSTRPPRPPSQGAGPGPLFTEAL